MSKRIDNYNWLEALGLGFIGTIIGAVVCFLIVLIGGNLGYSSPTNPNYYKQNNSHSGGSATCDIFRRFSKADCQSKEYRDFLKRSASGTFNYSPPRNNTEPPGSFDYAHPKDTIRSPGPLNLGPPPDPILGAPYNSGDPIFGAPNGGYK